MNRPHRHPARVLAIALFAVVVGACGSNVPSPTPATASTATSSPFGPSAVPSEVSTADPEATLHSAPSPSPVNAPTPTPEPTPAPRPAPQGWTAQQVGKTGCYNPTAGFDETGRTHLAVTCDYDTVYYASDGHGSWTSRVFDHPAQQFESSPQIAFRGMRVYVAYTRYTPGDCGSTYHGVYFRSRVLPNGAWSANTRIGSVGDILQQFAVDGTTIHATVRGTDGHVYYETVVGTTIHRYPISGAVRGTSMSIGSDGRARIVYRVAAGLRYSVFTGSGFSTSKIGGSTGRDWDPALTLDAADEPHVAWTRGDEPHIGCGVNGPPPKDRGTYYATKVDGAWKAERIATNMGSASIQVDHVTGRVHVLVVSATGETYYTTGPDGRWIGTLVSPTRTGSAILRLDPATGTVLIVFISWESESAQISVFTKP